MLNFHFHFKVLIYFTFCLICNSTHVGCEVEKAKISTRILIWRVNLNTLDNFKFSQCSNKSGTLKWIEIVESIYVSRNAFLGIFWHPLSCRALVSLFHTLMLWWDCPATLSSYSKFMSTHFTTEEQSIDQSLNDTSRSFASLLVTMEPDHKFRSSEKELYWPFAIY